MEALWLPTVLNMLEDIHWHYPAIKDCIVGVFVGQVLKGLQYLHLTLWMLRDMCCADKGSLPQSIRQWQGQIEHLQKKSTSSVGKNGAGWCAEEGVPNNAISAPKLADF